MGILSAIFARKRKKKRFCLKIKELTISLVARLRVLALVAETSFFSSFVVLYWEIDFAIGCVIFPSEAVLCGGHLCSGARRLARRDSLGSLE